MYRVLPFLIACLLPSMAMAQISMESRYDPHKPIVVGCGCVVPEGWEISVQWRIRNWDPKKAPAELIAVDKQAHVWAPPGEHVIEMRARLVERAIVEIGGVERSVILDIEDVYDDRAFIVGTPPPPKPDPDNPDPPTPEPTGFKGKVSAALNAVPQASRNITAQIGQNYAAIAGQAAGTPTQWDPALMMVEVRNSHVVTFASQSNPSKLAAEWQTFFTTVHKAMFDEGLASNDLPGHIALFHAIAEVLQ
jgi:hypothetical protein